MNIRTIISAALSPLTAQFGNNGLVETDATFETLIAIGRCRYLFWRLHVCKDMIKEEK